MPIATMTRGMSRVKIDRLKSEYGLTEKQARFVGITLEAPELPRSKRAVKAGYGVKTAQTNGGRVLKSPRIVDAVMLENKKTLEDELKEYDEDPRAFVKKNLLAHTRGDIAHMSEHRLKALELMGKMSGEFKEHQIIDIGEDTRRSMARKLLED